MFGKSLFLRLRRMASTKRCGRRVTPSRVFKPDLECLENRFAPSQAQLLNDIGGAVAGSVLGDQNQLTPLGSTLYFSVFTDPGSQLGKYDGDTFTAIKVGSSPNPNPVLLTPLASTLYFNANDGNGRQLWSYDGSVLSEIKIGTYADANPTGLITVGNALYFSANDGTAPQLWRYDGANLTEIKGGTYSYPGQLTLLGNVLYFAAFDGTGSGLWSYDGSTVSEITVGSYSTPNVNNLTAVGNKLYFTANDGVARQLWEFDGSSVSEIKVGTYASPTPEKLTAVGSTLYFRANDDTGIQLWKYDGSALTEIKVGQTANPFPAELTAAGNNLFFDADDASGNTYLGSRLWRYDGSTLTEINIGTAANPNPSILRAVGTAVYFSANDDTDTRLWKYDGVAATEIKVGSYSTPVHLAAIGANLYFSAYDATDFFHLWKYNTVSQDMQDLVLQTPLASSNPSSFVSVGGEVYFSADDGFHGRELWKTDGTASGTLLVSDINPGIASSNPSYLTAAGNTLYFTANDGSGYQLWKYDGSTLTEIKVGGFANPIPLDMTPVGNDLYFSANDGTAFQLWKYDGSTVTEIKVGAYDPNVHSLVAIGNVLYFVANDLPNKGAGYQLWKYDGSTLTEIKVATFPDANRQELTPLGGVLYFSAFGDTGYQAWKYDGLAVTQISANIINLNHPPTAFTAFDGSLYFDAYDGRGSQLWKYDGSTLTEIKIGAYVDPGPYPLRVAGSSLYFIAYDGTSSQLWKYDGSAVTEIDARKFGTLSIYDLAAIGSTVFFSSSDGHLLQYDGSSVIEIPINPLGSVPRYLTAIRNTLYFSANDGSHGSEPWIVTVPASAPTHFTVSAPAIASAGTPVNFTVTAEDTNNTPVGSAYTGTIHFSSTDGSALLPADAALTNGTGVFTATLNSIGAATISASDTSSVGITGTSNLMQVSPQATQLSVSAPASVTAGSAFIVTVTAQDGSGRIDTTYSGPVHFATSSGATALLPPDGTLSHGVGSFLITLQSAGSFVVKATDSANAAIAGASSNIAVIPAPASYFTVRAPIAAITGAPIQITVNAVDAFGNAATGYSGSVHFASSDASAILPADAPLTNGVGTFTVTLRVAGAQTITVTDDLFALPTVTGTSNTITTRGLIVTALTPTPTGFSVTFNKPIIASDINLYGGTIANPIQNVTLVGTATAPTFGPVNGTFVIGPSGTSATFEASSDWLENVAGSTSAVLPNDTWTVTLQSGAGTGSSAKGFFDALGAPLDGANDGGHADYTATFTTAYDGKPALTISDFARGPDSANTIKVPNNSANGIPVALANAPAGTKDVAFTLTYNPTLLTVTRAGTGDSGGTGSTFTMDSITTVDATHAKATFTWHNDTGLAGNIVLGDILANVPDSAANQYRAKELLTLDSITLNGAPFTGVTAPAVHVNAYFGDLSGDGHLTGLDLATASNVAAGTPTSPIGLSAYPLVDPALIGDIGSDGSIDAAAISSLAALLAHVATPAIPTPPAGLAVTPGGPDPALSLGKPVGYAQEVGRIGNPSYVTVPVLLDHSKPEGSTGITEAILGLTYDPTVLTVSAADITLGSIPASGSGWQLKSVIDSVTGQIAIDLYSTTPISQDQAGSLVNITFHVAAGAYVPATAVQLVSSSMPNGHWFQTELADGEGQMVLSTGVDRVWRSGGREALTETKARGPRPD